MPRISLPDGSVREFNRPVTAMDVAKDIGPGLAKAALGAKVDGELRDLEAPLPDNCQLALVTATTRDKQPDPDGLALLRHSAAHVMAEAIERVFPGVQFVYGPPVQGGFYYDIAMPQGRTLSSDDFHRIETEMDAIRKEDRPFTRTEMTADEGMQRLHAEGNKYKVDNAQRAIEQGADTLTWYVTGEAGSDAWEDLCKGPHVPSTGKIGAIKVMSLASSYWHGDANSDSLTRVYGVAFATKKALDEHLTLLEEAKKRDHRVIGKKLGLFHIDEAVGQGLVLWTPKGSVVREELQRFIGAELREQGYDQVFTPHIGKLDLYRASGHFPYYADSQFPPIIERDTMDELADQGAGCGELAGKLDAGDIDGFMLRPMNCPHHIKLYESQPRSYRDLPVRLAEFGTVYRWEQSGELSGMTRVRGFTQDDGHIFCTPDQVADEIRGCLALVQTVFKALGMHEYRVRVGTRDTDSAKYVGDPAGWDRAEAALRAAAEELGAPFKEEPGEAAFYGPKIDFIVKDAVGREWQLGTVQVDYNLPERFGLQYIDADNSPKQPVMLHRAPFGSLERFVGVLIEHFEGAFPTWLSPEQCRVLPISEKSNDYAKETYDALRTAGIRVGIDTGDTRVQGKIKAAAEERVPYLFVVGPRDATKRAVSVRARGVQKDLGQMPRERAVELLGAEVLSRGARRLAEAFEHTKETADTAT